MGKHSTPEGPTSPWLTEEEAAAYCRCSLEALREMASPAGSAGDRKVYHFADLDASLRGKRGLSMGAAEKRPDTPWLTEQEAALYCRCSLWSFRQMNLPAQNSGGRKVYHRTTLDASIHARTWQRSTPAAEPGTSTSVSTGGRSDIRSKLQSAKRLRPFVPRKRQNSEA